MVSIPPGFGPGVFLYVSLPHTIEGKAAAGPDGTAVGLKLDLSQVLPGDGIQGAERGHIKRVVPLFIQRGSIDVTAETAGGPTGAQIDDPGSAGAGVILDLDGSYNL